MNGIMSLLMRGTVATLAALVLATSVAFLATAAPNAKSTTDISVTWIASDSVTVSAGKDLSHVVILYCSGAQVKHDDLDVGPVATFSGEGVIHSITAKAGTSEVLSLSTFGCTQPPPDGEPR